MFNLCLSVGTHIAHITPLVLGTVEVENYLFFSFSTLPTAMLLYMTFSLTSHIPFSIIPLCVLPFYLSITLPVGLYLSTVLSQCNCLLLYSEWWLEFLAGLGSLVVL